MNSDIPKIIGNSGAARLLLSVSGMLGNKVAMSLLVAGLVGCASDGRSTNPDGGGSDAPPFTNGVSTLSGAAEAGLVDGVRGVARFNNPVNVAWGPDGKLYVADYDNGKLRVVTEDGTASTVISANTFRQPFGLVFAGSTLYVSTDANMNGMKDSAAGMTGSVWRIDIGAKTATIVANAIGRPRGLAALRDGRLALADYEHHVIETLDPQTGRVAVLAGVWNEKGFADGVGAAARFDIPYALVQRADGKLIVTDWNNNKLRIVGLDGTVTTFAGTTQGFQDGAMSAAKFSHPQGLAMTSNGDLYITDLGNYRIRKLAGDGSSVQTIAGDGMNGYLDDDDRLASELSGLEGLSVKADGSMIYVADGTRGETVPSNRIRQVKMQ
ncbi:MAG: repeat-containing protein [Myxococcales bacterium]|nr:repeat-containing protein [Myxococcales bacterium]